ncbi:MAG: 2-hydroxychromene-2-carboxylate isomerase [Novosphingobium sp.]
MKQIDFYFDFWSPYAYLASGRLAEMAEKYGCAINYCPIDLTKAKLSAGNTGPPNLQIPPKIRYLMTDLKRWAALYGLPFGGVPKSKDTKRINIGALLAQDRGMARDYVREAYDATWGQGGDPNSDELLSALAAKLGWDAAEFLGYIGSPAAEERYEAIFEAAVQRGVFGVPIMIFGDEMWWGNDRLDFLEQFLKAQAAIDT